MTATDKLRRMLDERGVEWGANDTYRLLVTSWNDVSGHSWAFMEHRDGSFSKLTAYHLTPEQAIAATLGVTDATAVRQGGAGTCQDLGGTGANGEQVFNCSECGCVLSLYDRDGSNNLCTSFVFDYPRYCPNCGREVVDE